MSWNYRLVKKEFKHEGKVLDTCYYIVEAFYDSNGKVTMITQEPEGPSGENISDLLASYIMLAEAFKAPILNFDQIPEPGAVDFIKEAMKDLEDEQGNRRSTEELIAEGKLIEHNVVIDNMCERLGKSREEHDKEMEVYRQEVIDKAIKDEEFYNSKLIGADMAQVIGIAIDKYVDQKTEWEKYPYPKDVGIDKA